MLDVNETLLDMSVLDTYFKDPFGNQFDGLSRQQLLSVGG